MDIARRPPRRRGPVADCCSHRKPKGLEDPVIDNLALGMRIRITYFSATAPLAVNRHYTDMNIEYACYAFNAF